MVQNDTLVLVAVVAGNLMWTLIYSWYLTAPTWCCMMLCMVTRACCVCFLLMCSLRNSVSLFRRFYTNRVTMAKQKTCDTTFNTGHEYEPPTIALIANPL